MSEKPVLPPENPVVTTAKQRVSRNGNEPHIVELKHGGKAEILPVSASLIDEVTSRIKDPEVPMWHNQDKGREEPNPSDPNYLKAVEKAEHDRSIAALDAMIMFGVRLVEGMPEDDRWLKNLQLMSKMGHVDLENFDLEDELTLEFLYKRFVVADTDLIEEVSKASGMTGEELEQATQSFQGN